MSRIDDYTTGNSLDFSYNQDYCKFIGIDLSRQTNTNILQQINFTGKLVNSGTSKWWNIIKY